ncbi:MAG: hypothetical protein ABW007_20065 [Chitinophagaceae bacterium]
MSFIQHLQSFRQHTAAAVVIFASVSFFGCTTSARSCADPGSGQRQAAIQLAASAEQDHLSVNARQNAAASEADYTGGPMNESASLPLHMTE